MNNGRVFTKRSTTEKGIIEKLIRCQSNAILFHHRTPTSTDNVIESCHPFVVDTDKGKIILVHNGVIHNAQALFKEHKELGIEYKSLAGDEFNDSESLAIDFARYISGEQKELKAHGWIAFIAYQTNKENEIEKIYFGKGTTAELNMKFTNKFLSVGSEVEGKEIKSNRLYIFDVKTKKLNSRKLEIRSYYQESSYQGDREDDWSARVMHGYLPAPKKPCLDWYKDKYGAWHSSDDYDDDGFDDDDVYDSRSSDDPSEAEAKIKVISALSDRELAMEIGDIEMEIQAIEAITPQNDVTIKKLDKLYFELEFYGDEEDSRRDLKAINDRILIENGAE